MGNWLEAILFGCALVAFVLSLSSIIMGFLPQANAENALKTRVEYGFFGVSGLAVFFLLVYALTVN
ncbi:MAG: hypothetical protein ACI965_001283 [Paraglaciecola sp.]|jgi:hypothetical protein